jgi:hypothetical protein
MTEAPVSTNNLIPTLVRKASMKMDIYDKTCSVFQDIKQIVRDLVDENKSEVGNLNKNIAFEYNDIGEFEIELKFGGDVLIFLMHTNIFEFSRDHEVMKTSYVKDDNQRSYCGMITIFNFLADSFKYKRMNDIGYLIGRLFINKELHYFIEGKREIGLLYNNFPTAVIDKAVARQIVESAMMYTIHFDLLTPPFDSMKEVSVSDMEATLENMPLKTGKRLGFRFQADQ